MKQNPKSNIVLIGMPGSGKSTVGVILAKILGLDFTDGDILIQKREGQTLQEIINSDGHMRLRQIEEEVLLSIDLHHHVIATGGSAPYSHSAMTHLKVDGMVLFLETTLATLKGRINNYETRGLAKPPEQSFADLFNERHILYRKYADITVTGDGLTQDEVCEVILKELQAKQELLSFPV